MIETLVYIQAVYEPLILDCLGKSRDDLDFHDENEQLMEVQLTTPALPKLTREEKDNFKLFVFLETCQIPHDRLEREMIESVRFGEDGEIHRRLVHTVGCYNFTEASSKYIDDVPAWNDQRSLSVLPVKDFTKEEAHLLMKYKLEKSHAQTI